VELHFTPAIECETEAGLALSEGGRLHRSLGALLARPMTVEPLDLRLSKSDV